MFPLTPRIPLNKKNKTKEEEEEDEEEEGLL